MSKNGLILVSLVAAVPGAVLVFLMAMSFISYAGGPSIWSKLLAILALLIGLLLMVMPVGIFVFTGPKAEKAAEKKSGEETESESADSQASGSLSHADSPSSAIASTGTSDPNLEVDEGEPDEFAVTGEIVTSDMDSGSEEFDLGSDFELGATGDEAVEVSDSEDEIDDGAPKKKKR